MPTFCVLGYILGLKAVSAAYELTCSANRGYHRLDNRPLQPRDLPDLRLFQEWTNSSLYVARDGNPTPNSPAIQVSSGTIPQAGEGDFVAEFDMLRQVVKPSEYEQMLDLLQEDWLQSALDIDPDSVDGYSTQEFFLDNENLRNGQSGKPGYEFPQHFEARKELRAELMKMTRPILEERITPFVNQRFPGCRGECTPCHSLIRRYIHGERQSHFPHRDGHAYATVVVSLSDHGDDYLGGLYVASEPGNPYFLALRKGDAAVHQGDLLHGVKVYPLTNGTEPHLLRWSWILWFKDSKTCSDNSYNWSEECALDGNPTCAAMHANSINSKPGLSDVEKFIEASKWNMRAAELGQPTACVKVARQLLGKFASVLKPSRKEALMYFRKAIDSANDPDAHYGVATMYLEDAQKHAKGGKPVKKYVDRAVRHLEASAIGGNPYAFFNLGFANLLGYGVERNVTLAGEWFEASGLPEGYAFTAMLYMTLGQDEEAKEFQRRADVLGFGTEWRKLALEHTGYGGSAGADFDLPWPPNDEGQVPPTSKAGW